MEELLAFLAARYDEDQQFAQDLVSTQSVPPPAYAIGVALAQRILTEVRLGRRVMARCTPASGDEPAVVGLKVHVLKDLAAAHGEHPSYQNDWAAQP